MKNNQSGRSMVEMLGVLAIIGVLSAGGLAGYSKAMFKHKLNSTMDQLTMLVTNIRTMYGTQDNYNNLSVAQAYGLGIIAASASQGDNHSKMINPFKGDVELESAVVKGTIADSGFVVSYEGLPKEACIALATSDWGTGAGSGYIGVEVGEDDFTTAAAATVTEVGAESTDGKYSEGTPMTVADAIDGCAAASNTVKLYFY
ncbi:MAG: hypothetical protein J6W11_02480 [Alphaproteobacteria bacterium]|nr:hypothetical protein [Alphaproteobacteria bacterium]